MRFSVKEIFDGELSLEDARLTMAHAVEDAQRTRARQVFESPAQALRVLAKYERYLTQNYGVAREG